MRRLRADAVMVEVLGGLSHRPGAGDVLDQAKGLEVAHRLVPGGVLQQIAADL